MESKVSKMMKLAADDVPMAEPYTMPDTINGKPVRVVGVRENIIKIQMHDPVAFLSGLMAGKPINSHYIDEDGRECVTPEFATLKERISIAKFLTDKVMPTMHISRDMGKTEDAPGKTGFDALVDEAINRGRSITAGTKTLGKEPH